MSLNVNDDTSVPASIETAQKYADVNRFVEDLLGGSGAPTIEAMVEKHQRKIGPQQRQVLLWLLASPFYSHRQYALQWMDLAGQEGNAGDFIELQKARTIEIPEQGRSLSFNPGQGH
jgi:hypothetical protein